MAVVICSLRVRVWRVARSFQITFLQYRGSTTKILSARDDDDLQVLAFTQIPLPLTGGDVYSCIRKTLT